MNTFVWAWSWSAVTKKILSYQQLQYVGMLHGSPKMFSRITINLTFLESLSRLANSLSGLLFHCPGFHGVTNTEERARPSSRFAFQNWAQIFLPSSFSSSFFSFPKMQRSSKGGRERMEHGRKVRGLMLQSASQLFSPGLNRPATIGELMGKHGSSEESRKNVWNDIFHSRFLLLRRASLWSDHAFHFHATWLLRFDTIRLVSNERRHVS